jgi:murein DD-endopeptidase MepM/ murein hydrolase activator NlpD
MTDKSATQLIAALGVLASKLGGAARTRKEEIRAANDFANSVTVAASRAEKAAEKQAKKSEDFANAAAANAEQLRRASLSAKQIAEEQVAAAKKQKDADNAALATSISNQRRQTSSSREVFEAAKQAGGGLSQLNDKFLDLGKGSVAAQSGLQLISSVAGGAAKALLGYSSAIQNGERGAKLSGRALEQFATPVLDTISTLGTLAMLLPGVGKVFGKTAGAAAKASSKMLKFGGAAAVAGAEVAKFGIKFVQAGLEQTDKLFDSFQRLSEVGISGAQGMDDVFGMLQEIGLTTGQIEQFNSLLAANGPKIKFLGATAFDGATELAKVAGGLYKSKLGQQLENLGVTQKEMNELTLANLSIEARSGRQRKKTDEELKRSTYEFVKELDMAAQLTGASRKEMAEAREAALSEERFRAALVDAQNRGDEEEIKRLEKARDMAAIIKNAGDAKGATGILQLAAGRGAMTTDAARSAEMQYGANNAINSPGSAIEGVKQMIQVSKETNKNLSGITRIGGNIDALSTGFVESQNVVDRIGPAIEAAGGDPEALLRKLQEDQRQREAATTPDGKVNNTGMMVDAARMQQNAALITDKSVFQLSNAATIHSLATKAFEGAVKTFGEVVGTMPKSQVTTRGAEVDAAKKAAYEAKQYAEARKQAEGIAKMQFGSSSLTEEDIERTTQALIRKMPKYADGGIAAGPSSGHLAMLHGTEAVIPLAGGGIPVKLSGGGGIESGPVFNPQTETNFLLEKNNEELVKSNVTLSQILEAITGGATVTGGGGAAAMAQEALAEHDHAHPHEPAAAADPELAKQIGKIVNPLEKMNQTSGFVRNDGKTGHGAIDLAGKIGDKVMAPISGMARVLSEKESGGYGNMVEVTDEKTGVKHMLAHLDKSMVKTGEMIKAGQQIGTLGNTGKSTGAHLHHEMRDKFGKKIDPSQFYSGPGFGSTAGGAATGYPQMVPRGRRGAPGMASEGLGSMSEKYETGGRGSGTVGWDKVGGTSYGKYQIASKVGAMKDFLKFAEQSGRGDVAKKLRDAGAESDTGGTSGKSVDVWKQMAASGELGDLESQFIKQKSFDPAMSGLKDDDLRKRIEGNKALKEMMFSTSVQHGGGGAAGIMNKVYKKGMSDEDLIKATYAERGTRFGGSTAEVQKSVKNRFVSEEKDVMAMLGMPAGNGVPGAAPGAPMVAGAQSGPRTTGSLRSALGLPEGSAGAGAGTGGLMGMLGGMLGLGGSTTGQAGITAGGAPGAIGSDISAITQAMEAQTAATQTAITSGMENLTTQLVDKLGGAGGTNDPAVPTLLGEILAAQRDQTTAINKLIQVSTA